MLDASSNAAIIERFPPSALSAERGCEREAEIVDLFGKMRSPLLRYMLTFGITAHDGEEIIQEAFLALFKHLACGRSRANLHGWLFRVCHNLALKHLERARGRPDATNAECDCVERHADSALNPEQQLAETQRRNKLQAVLRALPDQDRYCICLRAEGLRYREIAEILGMSLGAVSISLTRSLARFERADQE
jgi:RNA polymerase sigma-70 factor (ECF subfamily)